MDVTSVIIFFKEMKKVVYEPGGLSSGADPCLCGMKRLGVFLLPHGLDASPSQGYP